MNFLDKKFDLEFLLIEGRLEDVKRKYTDSPIAPEVIDRLSESDPSGNNKYLDWMVKQVLLNHGFGYVVSMVNSFENALPRLKIKDINAYESVDELEEALDSAIKTPVIKVPEEKIYEDEKYIIYQPQTKESSCSYGSGARWCISANGSGNQFDNYIYNKNQDPYFLISKDEESLDYPEDKKLAIMFSRNSDEPIAIYDNSDDLVASDGGDHPASGKMIRSETTIQFLEDFLGEDFEKIYSVILNSHKSDPLLKNRQRRNIDNEIRELQSTRSIFRYLNNVEKQDLITSSVLFIMIGRVSSKNAARIRKIGLRIAARGSVHEFKEFFLNTLYNLKENYELSNFLKDDIYRVLKNWKGYLIRPQNWGDTFEISQALIYSLLGQKINREFNFFKEEYIENGLCIIPEPRIDYPEYVHFYEVTNLEPRAFVIINKASKVIDTILVPSREILINQQPEEGAREVFTEFDFFGIDYKKVVSKTIVNQNASRYDRYDVEEVRVQLKTNNYLNLTFNVRKREQGQGYESNMIGMNYINNQSNRVYYLYFYDNDTNTHVDIECREIEPVNGSYETLEKYSGEPLWLFTSQIDGTKKGFSNERSYSSQDFKEIVRLVKDSTKRGVKHTNKTFSFLEDWKKDYRIIETIAANFSDSQTVYLSFLNDVKGGSWTLRNRKYDEESEKEILKFLDFQDAKGLKNISENTILKKLLGR